ncbi:macro domain-containing protein [Roseofilum casamattae]|uniref:Macro domain-containing protein n=1 Tax=Roseofilum casamattae BLCC-M143 TaxID=3022442 RepID=A0ABT7BYR1_9CYAN|nr:macro domain-containing protein [Roseofilum casamattae]MDJ1184333.1 macro domain-containing protein [Roseofilum casamattae BLCC-M143]
MMAILSIGAALKQHFLDWRNNSRVEDIEGGLQWLRDNAIKQGIESLAMPALGCGLGKLEWSDVGPLMCRYLNNIGIPVAIYLPREQPVDPKYLTREYLLSGI